MKSNFNAMADQKGLIMKNLSKSKYTTYCQCPKALWLRIYKPEEQVIDPSVLARFEAGSEVGEFAKRLFGEFEDVTSYMRISDGSERLDLKAMIAKTQNCLNRKVENIAEAAFSFDGCYCAVDILHKTHSTGSGQAGYAIYEVKSSTDLSHLEVYAQDVAYQKYVLTNCGINVTGTYLVNINNEYVLDGELNVKEFFNINDISEAVANEYVKVRAHIAKAKKMLEGDEPERDFGEYCHKPYGCAFWEYCSRDIIPHPSVFDLYRMSFKKALWHMNEGRLTLEDMRTEKLTDTQQLQLECTLGDKSYINKNGIKDFLKKLSYPLYFLDFETEQTVIPKYQGTHPYQQVTFQYSLHHIEKEGDKLKHTEFLGDGVTDPRRALAEQLCHDIPMNVCTTAYNKAFECTRLKELAEAYPDLAPHLINIKEHIVDLLDPFRAGYFYKPAMNGSFSIKKVLPALFPDDPQLDYHNLTGGVQNGGEAMSIYPKMAEMTPEERERTRKALLDYCCLDTYAMVKVWEKLREMSETFTPEIIKKEK